MTRNQTLGLILALVAIGAFIYFINKRSSNPSVSSTPVFREKEKSELELCLEAASDQLERDGNVSNYNKATRDCNKNLGGPSAIVNPVYVYSTPVVTTNPTSTGPRGKNLTSSPITI